MLQCAGTLAQPQHSPDAAPALTSHGSEVTVCLSPIGGKGAHGGEDDESEGKQQDLGVEGDVTMHSPGRRHFLRHGCQGRARKQNQVCILVPPGVCAPASTSIHLSLHVFCPSILSSIGPSFYPSLHLFLHLSVHPSIPICLHPFIYPPALGTPIPLP